MINEGIYEESEVQQRLQAVFGRVDAIRRRIDEGLENDDMHRRRQQMRVLPLPRNFPEPQSMGQSPVPTWIRWIREESERIVSELEEEIQRRNDPDDPFDGMQVEFMNPWYMTQKHHSFRYRKRRNPSKESKKQRNHSYRCQILM